MSDKNKELIKRRDFQLGLLGGLGTALFGGGSAIGASTLFKESEYTTAANNNSTDSEDYEAIGTAENDGPDFNPREEDLGSVINMLKNGGYILYFRHELTQGNKDQYKTDNVARPEDVAEWSYTDCSLQRNLSLEGRRRAERVGNAIENINIPIGDVYSSPFCRCDMHTEIAFGEHETTHDLNSTRENIGERVREMLSKPPSDGVNRAYVAHKLSSMDISVELTGGEELNEGECVIIDPTKEISKSAIRFISPSEFFSVE